jgi:hypothetical protein
MFGYFKAIALTVAQDAAKGQEIPRSSLAIGTKEPSAYC